MTKDLPSGWNWVETEAQDQTIYSQRFDENCHSIKGARDETIYNYIEGCLIEKKAQTLKNISIFETGFGLGMGPELVFELAKKYPNHNFRFVSTEIDEQIVKWSSENSKCELLNSLLFVNNNFQSKVDNVSLFILIGDAFQTINSLSENFDCFFQDPFSLKKNRTLWSVQWFEKLKKIAKDSATLSTYASAVSARKSMIEAGWAVHNRVGFKAKKSATIADFNFPTDEEISTRLSRSPKEAIQI